MILISIFNGCAARLRTSEPLFDYSWTKLFIEILHIHGFNKNEFEGIDAPIAVNGILY